MSTKIYCPHCKSDNIVTRDFPMQFWACRNCHQVYRSREELWFETGKMRILDWTILFSVLNVVLWIMLIWWK